MSAALLQILDCDSQGKELGRLALRLVNERISVWDCLCNPMAGTLR